MNAYLLCLLGAVTTASDLPAQTSPQAGRVYAPRTDYMSTLKDESVQPVFPVIRGQNPTSPDTLNSTGPVTIIPPATNYQANQPYDQYWNPGTPPAVQNPFLPPAAQAGMPNQFSTGLNGPQPYRFGWSTRADFTYMAGESVSLDPAAAPDQYGDFEQLGVDVGLEYSAPALPGWIFSFTQELGYRNWSGPDGSGAPGPAGGYGLPDSAYRIGWDLELATPITQGYSVQLGFTPSINTDFDGSISEDAWNFDARAIMFIHQSPEWMVALGAGYWDRVDDLIVPYAGVVWTPNDYWEWRLLFPESRVSYFLGMHDGFAKWLYVTCEYNVESYQINRTPMQVRDQIQFEDWRVLLGLRSDNGLFTIFLEGGWVFGRDVDFKRQTPGFEISDGFIGRAGIRF